VVCYAKLLGVDELGFFTLTWLQFLRLYPNIMAWELDVRDKLL